MITGDTPVLVHNCNSVMLGARDRGTAELANKVGAKHFLGKEYQYTWREEVLGAIADRDVTIHVNLRGFDGGDAGFLPAVQAGLGKGAKATQEEMRYLASAVAKGERAWNTIKFYGQNGRRVYLPEPDWPSLMRGKEGGFLPPAWFDWD